VVSFANHTPIRRLKDSDVIHADCYSKFENAMITLNNNPAKDIYKNHIKYVHIFKYHPSRIKTFFYNREFDIPIKNISSRME